jgi:hypothetical protein
MTRFSDRWNQKAATLFADAHRAGIADNFDSFLEEFFRLRRFTSDELAPLDLPGDAMRFLTEEGLPVDAAPFLSLQSESILLRPVIEQWACRDNDRRARLTTCFSLYSDGSGNPICLDTARQGALLWFDHETELAGECYVNASVNLLAEFLLLRMGAADKASPMSAYAEVESNALLPGTFWHAEVAL